METTMIIRTITLIIALLNLSLVLAGYSPLPIENEEIEQLFTMFFTIGASLWVWWKDNDISRTARKRKNKDLTPGVLKEHTECHISGLDHEKLFFSSNKGEKLSLQEVADSKSDLMIYIRNYAGEYKYISMHELAAGVFSPSISAENIMSHVDEKKQHHPEQSIIKQVAAAYKDDQVRDTR